MNIKILVCCHKKDVYASESPYFPIHVGKQISKLDLGIQGDNEGENISSKNSSYCELTGMYWAWKNMKNVDIIGVCHYRRYFDFHNQCRKLFPETIFSSDSFNEVNIRLTDEIINELKKGRIIMPKERIYGYSLFFDYCFNHISDDIKILADVIKEDSPQYYDAFVETMHFNNKLMHYNMFVMNWTDFDRYCNWLFPLLYKVEEKIDISNYSSTQKRIYGYMAERLLNVWVKAEGYKIKKYPIIWFNNGLPYDNDSFIKYFFRRCFENMIFWENCILKKILFKIR